MNHNQQGSALIIVIWFIAIIGVIATFLFYRTEVEWASVVNIENKLNYEQEAEVVLHQRLELLVNGSTDFDSPNDAWYSNGRVDLEQDGFKITVIIEDEGSKPNLNYISDNGLQQIAQLVSKKTGTTDDKPISVDPVLDWRDRNQTPRPEGAKLSYYQSLNPPYKPRDGCFSSLEEIKLVKNGDQLYPLLAPEVTVFGRVNPNTISGDIFVNLLNSYKDFPDFWLDAVKDQFNEYRSKNRFTKIDDFSNLENISITTRDEIEPLFQFQGHCNINLATANALTVTLTAAGYDTSLVSVFLKRRKDQPFQNIKDIYPMLGYIEARPTGKADPDDYFTVLSTIIRYQIWIIKGSSKYYLNTIWERHIAGIKKEWQVNPLAWHQLINNDVPEIPNDVSTTISDKEPDKKDGQ